MLRTALVALLVQIMHSVKDAIKGFLQSQFKILYRTNKEIEKIEIALSISLGEMLPPPAASRQIMTLGS
jgi:hypothetical protein